MDYGDRGGSITGLLCFYGELIPVLDLYEWFGQKRMGIRDTTVFLIMTSGGRSFAFQISGVMKSADVPNECFQAIPGACKSGSAGAFSEVIDWDGALYLEISAEAVLEKLVSGKSA